MDYEKKYNEALKWMRELYPGLHGATKEDAEHYFHELRERIMKELIFFLKEEIPQCSIKEHADKLKEFVSYLEKQKDTSQEREQEDEKMLDSVIRIITQFDDLAHEPTFAGPKWTHPYTKELAWLKSLLLGGVYSSYDMAKAYVEGQYNILKNLDKYRPSFKPSEEQMEALLWCIAHLGGADRRVLAELYEHLKMYCK